MRRFLLLTAGFGEGHNTAARNVRDALLHQFPEALVEVHDIFAESYGLIHRAAQSIYRTAINEFPGCWQFFFELLNSPAPERPRLPALTSAQARLKTVIDRLQPEGMVVTYPVYNHLLDRLYPSSQRPWRHVTVVTDSITLHSLWFTARGGIYSVSDPMTANVLRRHGVTDEIRVLGFPVSRSFHQALEPDTSALDHPHVLWMLSGRIREASRCIDLLTSIPGVQLTLTAGKNAALQCWAESTVARARHWPTNLHARQPKVLGWTNEMPRLMMKHHILIGKAGGATTHEALAAHRPMIVTHIVPGQEAGNFEVLRTLGAGFLATTPEAIHSAVARLLANGAQEWNMIRHHLATRPGANADSASADQIARLVAGLAS